MSGFAVRGALLASFLVGMTSCGGGAAPPVDHTPSVTKIVKTDALSAFRFLYDTPEGKAALRSFRGKIETARQRSDLDAAWNTEPVLAATPDFLKERVYEAALRDRDFEIVFADGVRSALDDFLKADK